MLTKTICFAIAIALLININAAKKSSKSINFVSVETIKNPLYLADLQVIISGNNTDLSIYTEIIRTINSNIWMSLGAILNPIEGYRSRPMLEHDLNVCELLDKRNAELGGFIKVWLIKFFPKTKWPSHCPVLKGNYSAVGLSMDKLFIPKFFPDAMYRVKVHIYIRKKPVHELISETTVLLQIK